MAPKFPQKISDRLKVKVVSFEGPSGFNRDVIDENIRKWRIRPHPCSNIVKDVNS